MLTARNDLLPYWCPTPIKGIFQCGSMSGHLRTKKEEPAVSAFAIKYIGENVSNGGAEVG